MSNRANATKYGGGVSHMSTTPQGGTSLISLLTGNSPKQLQGQQQQHEVTMEDLMHQHEQEIMKLQKDLASKLANEQAVIDLAKQQGVTPEALSQTLAPKLTQNAMARLQNETIRSQREGEALDPNKNPNIQGSFNMGANLKATGLPPPSIAPPTVPQGGVGGLINVPGFNSPSNTPLGIGEVKGSTVNQSSQMGGGIPMKQPDGSSIMVGQQPITTMHNMPGGITMPQPPVSQDEINKASGGAPQQLPQLPTTPQTGNSPFSQMPQGFNPMPQSGNSMMPPPTSNQGGQLPTTPPMGSLQDFTNSQYGQEMQKRLMLQQIMKQFQQSVSQTPFQTIPGMTGSPY